MRRTTIPTLAAALCLALPGAALAKHGGGGGGDTNVPPPTVGPTITCDYSTDGVQADGSTLMTNPIGDIGCVTVRVSGDTIRLYSVVLAEGWTYDVTSNGGGTNSRVGLDVLQPSTGDEYQVKIEFGKTDIRRK